MVGHVLVLGETQSGKTYFANQCHRQGGQALSVFYNTNHVPYVWGRVVHSLKELIHAVAGGHSRINYIPPADQVGAQAHLTALKDYLFAKGRPGPVWCVIFVDEAQRYTTTGGREDPVEDIARRGLGAYGVMVVAITQYPTALNPGTRTNCPVRIIFRPGIEGLRFIQTYGAYPFEDIRSWTDQKRYAATYTPDRGWKYHSPL